MKINKKGQCPVCLRKPLTYKRDKLLFCYKCSRTFNIKTGEWIPNHSWVGENEKSRLSKMADLAMETGIARPCDVNEDGLHKFVRLNKYRERACMCGATN